jgi:lipid-A-disaccharide synthase
MNGSDSPQPRIMIVAGEASGDLHGAKLARSILGLNPGANLCGIGGHNMREAGVDIRVDAAQLAVVGITEVVSRLPYILKGLKTAKAILRNECPDLLILIDFPDFNFKLAAAAKRCRVKVLYYISPQIWAWRSGRVKKIKRLVDHMAVILPFEVDFYRRHHVPVTFVGHPLLDGAPLNPDERQNQQSSDRPVIGLIPGSRGAEIARHLPVMLAAAQKISRRIPDCHFVISKAPTVSETQFQALISPLQDTISMELATTPAREIFNRCKMAVAASGTVTMEAAMCGTPLVIIYKVSPLSYWLGRLLVDVDYIGIVNLIAGRELAPELIQEEANPEAIAGHVCTMLKTPENLVRLGDRMRQVREKLGRPGASRRVAKIALSMLG